MAPAPPPFSRPSIYPHPPRLHASPLSTLSPPSRHPPLAHLRHLLTHPQLHGFRNLLLLLLPLSLLLYTAYPPPPPPPSYMLSPVCLSKFRRDSTTLLRFLVWLPVFVLLEFSILVSYLHHSLSYPTLKRLHIAALTTASVAAVCRVWALALNPLFALILMLSLVVLLMKMHSFVWTHVVLSLEVERCRRKTAAPCTKPPFPVVRARVADLAYFLGAPSLVYERHFVRGGNVRWPWLAWWVAHVVLGVGGMYWMVVRFCVPVWRAVAEGGMPVAEGVGRSVGVAFGMWLVMFWGFFHCALNAWAELMRFGDRRFYLEWWNAANVGEFWRAWNRAVYEWCLRHVYVELVHRGGWGGGVGGVVVFLLSAVVHEVVCAVGFRVIRGYLFACMVAQVPLVWGGRRWRGRWGNWAVWAMLMVGQGVIVLMYVKEFLRVRGTLMCAEVA